MSFKIEVPATYPDCYISVVKRGMPDSDDDEMTLDECAKFAGDRIEHTWAKRIGGENEGTFEEIAMHAEDAGAKCSYDPYGGPDGRGAIVLSMD